MDLSDSEREAAFRAEPRAFLDAHPPVGLADPYDEEVDEEQLLARSADDLFQALTRPAVTGPSPGNLDLELAPDLVVTGALFGVIELDDDGAPRFAPAEAVPLEPGLEFGWVVWLETGRPSVRWREVFRSASPDNWQIEGDGDYRLSEDRTTMTLEQEVAPDAGRIANFWQVAPGDLPGPHRLRVFVEDAPVADFAFEVR